MRIAFVVAVYPPEPEPSSVMAAELARAWVAAGHDVTVVCPVPNRPRGVVYAGFERRPWHVADEGGVRVVRVASWLIGEQRRGRDRVLENASFGLASAAALLAEVRPDVALVESWPVLAYLPLLAVARARGIPVVNYVKDVYPEAAVAAGVLPAGSRTARALARLDALICRSAARNVVISERQRDLLVQTRGLEPERCVIIPDWVDLAAIRPFEGPSSFRAEIGVPEGAFVGMFAGTMGLASGCDVLVDVAERLKGDPRIRLVCVGQGMLQAKMAEAKAARGLDNLVLLPFQPRERVSEVQSSADVMLLTSSPAMGASSVPSKLITYLAVGKPVICGVAQASDIADLVRGADVGQVVPAGDAPALAAALVALADSPREVREALGRRARQVAVERHSLASAVERFGALLGGLGLPS